MLMRDVVPNKILLLA